jgi:Uma2 family endonuclease
VRLELDLPALPITAEEFALLPEPEGVRFELWEGNLFVMAAAQAIWRSVTARRIESLFLNAGRMAVREIGVRLSKGDVPSPDVSVLRAKPGSNEVSQVPASDVDCVVEVVSPESVFFRDKVAKFPRYAASGIPAYWIAERHPNDEDDAMLTVFALNGVAYEQVQVVALTELEVRGL